MPDLGRSLGKFLYRDLFYIVAGFIILSMASRVFRVQGLLGTDSEAVNALLLVVFAYAVGILNQELWSQLPFVKTCTYDRYPNFLLGVYRRHMGEEWTYRAVRSKAVSDDPDYQRTINLKQIGAALGTSLFTGALFSMIGSIVDCSIDLAWQALGMVLIGALFVMMSWLHNMRQAAFQPKLKE
jgi:hypothetical protein